MSDTSIAEGGAAEVQDDFLTPSAPESAGLSEPSLRVDVEGFEGPLDLLLTLARSQKVDITKVSILQLTEQYLSFVREARRLRLELAADYLVMAAWLAYLKSRLLLPVESSDDEPSGEELAAALAFRLQRLEAMRDAAAKLMNLDRLRRDVFPRGTPETVSIEKTSVWSASLYDLLTAYASQRQRSSVTSVHYEKRQVWSLQEARALLQRLIGAAADWTPIDRFLLQYMDDPRERSTILASTFSASLELVREGQIELQQSGPFERLYMRSRPKLPEADEQAQEQGALE
ncbi:ScpA family protein [Pseudovibrio sp. SPO723]|uniref:segregation and condensation protein A n=1 Tax=Nesiotobacter zosterae TaxID=392721 RepID=UPI0029C3D0F0|nr:ScpA family protein [Pseudovibrio sp. SPO723]MDX5592814.1 ScpA family protein [Pseudovibrio sp. SPO723]